MPDRSHSRGAAARRELPHARWRIAALAGLIFLASALVYWPAVHGDFIWDDEMLLTKNRLIKAPDGLYRFWFTTDSIDYWPVTNTSFWLEWRAWETNPTGYHLTNLALHVASALLIWAVLAKLAIPGAWLAALLFAVHPVNVESVAWIAQRKNTLSMVFFLLSIWCYLKDDDIRAHLPERRGGQPTLLAGLTRWYWLSFLAFLLAMLSKGSVAILPLVLVGVAWWHRDRITKADLIRAAPFFAIAVALTLVNIWFQRHGGDQVIRDATLLERVLGASSVVWFYLYKAILPLNLLFIYPQWNVQADEPRWWAGLIACIAVTAMLLSNRHRGWGRTLLAAWAFFCLALLPVMGWTDISFMKYSLVADHYQYIALVAVVALIAAAWTRLVARLTGLSRSAAIGGAALVVFALVALSWRQSALYRDSETLYAATLQRNPDSWVIRNNLGLRLDERGHRQQAVEQYQAALQLNPDYPDAHYNLGSALLEAGQTSQAIDHFKAALRLQPHYVDALNNLAAALLTQGKNQEAVRHLQRAIELQPDFPKTYNNLGQALVQAGRLQDAIAQFQTAVRLYPQYAIAHRNLGRALMLAGRPGQAIAHFETARRLMPSDPDVLYQLGRGLTAEGRSAEAIAVLEQCLKLRPNNYMAELSLGIALVKSGRPIDAVPHYEAALRLEPHCVEAYANLASTYAQLNRPEAAVTTAQQGIALARDLGQTHLATQLQQWLDAYRAQLSNSQ